VIEQLGPTPVVVVATNEAGVATDEFNLTVGDIVTPVSTHFAFIGQSENVIGFTHTDNFYTQGPYPTLRAGVDAQIAIPASASKTGTDIVQTLSQVAIDDRDVSPGFVAMANLWHLATGEPAAAFGPASRVQYAWWNAEGAIARTLIDDRTPHLIGRNADGSPYDFTTGDIDYTIIDTANQGRGMFPTTAKLDVTFPGMFQVGSQDVYDPPYNNYLEGGRQSELAEPAMSQRRDFIDTIPEANRGVTTLSLAACLFGDYEAGVKAPAPSQTTIHPAMKDVDGQQLYSRHLAASLLIAQGHLAPSKFLRIDFATDGTYADVVFEMANGGDLTTMRQQRGNTPPSPPRPHQQLDGMGFVLYRSGDTSATARPLYRSDNSDDTLYPTAYRATVAIHDTGTDVLGTREAVVRITPDEAFVDGDQIKFGSDSGLGAFILHGYEDYDAHMYLDMLIEHIPSLAAEYDGLPLEYGYEATATGIDTGDDDGGDIDDGTDPTTFFTTSGTGPSFVDPNNVPANTSRIRHTASLRPTSAMAGHSGVRLLFGQESQGMDVSIRPNASDFDILLTKIEDSSRAKLGGSTASIYSAPYGVWSDFEFDADLTANTFTLSVNGSVVHTETLTAGTGTFQANRELSALSNSSGVLQMFTGLDVKHLEMFLTTDGLETSHKVITGDAATVNIDPWKIGDDAV